METRFTEEEEKPAFEIFLSYFAIWLRYKWFVIITTFLLTSAVIAICVVSLLLPPSESFMPNYYTAHAKILIQQSNQNDISSSILSALGINPTNSMRGFDYGAQIMELMRSRTIVDQLIDEFDLIKENDSRTKGQIRDSIIARYQFNYSSTTAIMRIMYTDSDPVRAKDMVNRLIGLLEEWYQQNRNLARQNQQQILEEKLEEVKKDIATLTYRLKTIPDIHPSYSQYASELDVQQRIYDTLSPQYEAARLAPESQPVFQVFELAEVPDMKAGPSRKNYVIIAFLMGFGGSSAMAFAINFLRTFKRKYLVKE